MDDGDLTVDRPLNVEQRARVEALQAARRVLYSNAVLGVSKLDAELTEVVDLSEYILTGRHPADRWAQAELA